MNWTDIEAKWTAMARRVQTDKSPDNSAKLTTDAQPPLLPEVLDERPAPSDRSAT